MHKDIECDCCHFRLLLRFTAHRQLHHSQIRACVYVRERVAPGVGRQFKGVTHQRCDVNGCEMEGFGKPGGSTREVVNKENLSQRE